jgi:putative transposase
VADKVMMADSGYQGIAKICPNATTPHKRKKKTPLTLEQKQANHALSSKRIIAEQINAKIKVFKIVKYPYRNRRKRFGLRMNLICGIIYLEAGSVSKDLDVESVL